MAGYRHPDQKSCHAKGRWALAWVFQHFFPVRYADSRENIARMAMKGSGKKHHAAHQGGQRAFGLDC